MGGNATDGGGAVATTELFTGIPTIQQVSPPVVSTAGGTDVVIKGVGLAPRGAGAVKVDFGRVSVTGAANADGTEIVVKAPAASAEGPVVVDATVDGVKAERGTTTPLVYAGGPKIDAIAPSRARPRVVSG